MNEGKRIMYALGEVDERFIVESAPTKAKIKKRFTWVKVGSLVACLLIIAMMGVIVTQRNHALSSDDERVTAPMITINEKEYVAPYMPVPELPDGYHYLRNLEEKEANSTGLEGCAIYVNPKDDEMSRIYLFQECGTPINQSTVDNSQRQWAYVAWITIDSQS